MNDINKLIIYYHTNGFKLEFQKCDFKYLLRNLNNSNDLNELFVFVFLALKIDPEIKHQMIEIKLISLLSWLIMDSIKINSENRDFLIKLFTIVLSEFYSI